MPLTDTAIRKLKATDKVQRLFDGGGLYLEVTPVGGRYWRLKYRYGGKEKRLALGVYPAVSLAAARCAGKGEGHLRAGRDPSTEKKADKLRSGIAAGNTFQAVGYDWAAVRAHGWTPLQLKKERGRLAVFRGSTGDARVILYQDDPTSAKDEFGRLSRLANAWAVALALPAELRHSTAVAALLDPLVCGPFGRHSVPLT